MAARNSPTELDVRSIVISRIIDAPRDLVFDAWTDVQHLAEWWGPDGFTTTTSKFDMRPGGDWRFVMHGPDGRDYENRITYEEIVRPERIVYHHGGGEDVKPVKFATSVTFEDMGGKTKLTMRAVFPTVAERDRVIKEYGAEEGGQQTLGRLAEHVAKMAAARQAPRRESLSPPGPSMRRASPANGASICSTNTELNPRRSVHDETPALGA